MSKFEQLLDYLVNEDHESANALFHEIVVEKSREIYENIISEEEDEKEEDESMEEAMADEEEADEGVEEGYEDETIESMFDEAGDDEDEGDDAFPVQDQTGDFEDDVTDHNFGGLGDEGDDAAPADKGDIKDVIDELEELKAKFAMMLSGEDAEEADHPEMDDVGGPDLDGGMGGDDEDEFKNKDEAYAFESSEDEDEDDDKDVKESRIVKTQGERMREYIEKVTATMDGGLVGARTGEAMPGPKEGKSPVSSGSGKPTSGATAKNIATDTANHNEDGQKPHGKVGGLVKTGGQFVGSGTKNVAASATAKKPDGAKLDSVKKPGNKEGEGWGAGKGDKAGQTGGVITKSPLTGAPNRAK